MPTLSDGAHLDSEGRRRRRIDLVEHLHAGHGSESVGGPTFVIAESWCVPDGDLCAQSETVNWHRTILSSRLQAQFPCFFHGRIIDFVLTFDYRVGTLIKIQYRINKTWDLDEIQSPVLTRLCWISSSNEIFKIFYRGALYETSVHCIDYVVCKWGRTIFFPINRSG